MDCGELLKCPSAYKMTRQVFLRFYRILIFLIRCILNTVLRHGPGKLILRQMPCTMKYSVVADGYCKRHCRHYDIFCVEFIRVFCVSLLARDGRLKKGNP